MQQKSISNFFKKTTKEDIKLKDIEDFGEVDASVPKGKVVKVTSRKRKSGKANMVEDAEEDEKNQAILNGPCPSMTEDYQGFYSTKRQNGRFNKPAERRRRLFGANSESSQRSTVGGMFRKRAENIAGTNWEILEYKLDPTKPGDLKVYVRAGDKVHTFNFHVPKKFMLLLRPSCHNGKVFLVAKLRNQMQFYQMVMMVQTYTSLQWHNLFSKNK